MDTSNNQNKSITSISNKVEFPVISFRYNIMNEWYLRMNCKFQGIPYNFKIEFKKYIIVNNKSKE